MRIIFSLALCSVAALAQPRIFYSDLDSGPRSGGENNQGAYVTIFGTGFGAARGTSSVTVGGGAVASYPSWNDGKVTFQLGGGAASGEIRIATGGGASNGVPFAVRGGNIYFVGPSGLDTNSGLFGSPWRTIQKAVDTIAAGDIIYLLNGASSVRVGTSDGSVTLSRNNGAAGAPKALVAYPGAVASIGQTSGSPCVSTQCVEGLRTTFASDYWTIAGLRLAGNDYALALRGRGLRIVGNDLTCPNGSGASACMDGSQSTAVSVYGNDVHDVGYGRSSDLYHGIYFSTDSTNIDIGWNTVRNIQGCRGIQFNSTALDNATGFNQYGLSIHDNYIAGTQCDGIVLSTVDPSQGAIAIYNNVIADAGRGPRTVEGGGNFSCIYAAGYRGSRSGPGSGVIEVYHNTLYNCGSFASANGYGGITYARRDTTIEVRLRNNIIVHTNGAPYWVNYDGGDQGLTGSNNLVFGNGAPINAGPSGTIVADPIFLNPAAGDFRIATNSPARLAGLNVGLATDKNGVARGAAPDIGAYQGVAGTGGGLPPTSGSPLLTVSTAAISASATQGSSPPAQSFTVGNAGQATLNYSIISTQTWAQPSPAGGTLAAGASQGVLLTLNAASLPLGTSAALVRVTGGGTQRDIVVNVTVSPSGGAQVVLSASVNAFDFAVAEQSDLPAGQSFSLRNAGTPGFTQSWRAQSAQGWVTLFPNAGFYDQNPQNIRVEVNPSGLPNGTHVAEVLLLSDGALNSPVRLTVRVTVGATPVNNSPLVVAPNAVDMSFNAGTNPDSRVLSLTNNGQQAVDAGVSTDQPWMQAVTQGGFGFLLPGGSQTVTLYFNAAALNAGFYTGTLSVGTGATRRDVPVRLTVNAVTPAPAGLSVDNTNFAFVSLDATSGPPAPQTVRLRHGGGTVNWTARTDRAWLSLSPNAGLVGASAQEIQLNVNATGLTNSDVATVLLEAPGALNSPVRLTVRLTVGGGGGAGNGTIIVSPAALDVNGAQGADAPAQTVFVSNTGAAVAFTATAEPSWLRVSPASGFVTSGGGQALTLSFASSGLAPGVYSGLVRVIGSLQREVQVRLTITAGGAPGLVASTDSFNFAVLDPTSDPPLPQAFRLRNGGPGLLNWSSRSNQAWVTLAPNAGQVSTLGQDVAVNVNPSGLPTGTHVAAITLTSASGAPVTLTVRFTVGGASDGGALSVSPAALVVTTKPGSSAPAQTVLLRNTTSQNVAFTATADQAWMLVSPPGGTLAPGNGQALTISLNTASLSAGTYLGTVRVQGGGVERAISVRVTVGAAGGGSAGGLTVSVDTFQFDHRDSAEDPPAPQSFRLNNATGNPVNWSARVDQAWLSLSPNGGYLGSAGDSVWITVNPSGLRPGAYTANVTIQVSGTTNVLRLTVRLNVVGP